jgi:hypothetical protein
MLKEWAVLLIIHLKCALIAASATARYPAATCTRRNINCRFSACDIGETAPSGTGLPPLA